MRISVTPPAVPFEDQYHQLITVEAPRFNNTLAPYMTCPNAGDGRLTDGHTKKRKWVERYLGAALPRVQAQIEGVTLTHEHLFDVSRPHRSSSSRRAAVSPPC